ncbi:hypothetical protein [Paenibacillus tyrfis]|uniref:hypothetical protein n=1 Tax=Paenibacillus tyrfis TaxID=1501230 RepID=UPI00209FA2E7|nr:hypothetical protein [Paenibacillus tyrfis]MCP1305732.1 hypothetical protein [Paenibacillus tyrfis]
MITARLAKQAMEHEEGMNHLWVRFELPQAGSITDIRLTLDLPQGVHRSTNLNGCPETDCGVILLGDSPEDHDVFLELYTEEAAACGRKELGIAVEYKDGETEVRAVQSISLELKAEDDAEDWPVDEEVIERIKALQCRLQDRAAEREREFVILPPIVRQRSGDFADWEKKYRIDYSFSQK